MDNTHEWCAEGIPPRPLKTGLDDGSQQAWIFRLLASGEVVHNVGVYFQAVK